MRHFNILPAPLALLVCLSASAALADPSTSGQTGVIAHTNLAPPITALAPEGSVGTNPATNNGVFYEGEVAPATNGPLMEPWKCNSVDFLEGAIFILNTWDTPILKGQKLHIEIMPSGEMFVLEAWTDVPPGEGIGFKDMYDADAFDWSAVSCTVTYA